MFQRLCTYFQDTGVLIFGGYVLSGHCSRQQISGKNEGVLIFGGVLIYGVLRYCLWWRFFSFWCVYVYVSSWSTCRQYCTTVPAPQRGARPNGSPVDSPLRPVTSLAKSATFAFVKPRGSNQECLLRISEADTEHNTFSWPLPWPGLVWQTVVVLLWPLHGSLAVLIMYALLTHLLPLPRPFIPVPLSVYRSSCPANHLHNRFILYKHIVLSNLLTKVRKEVRKLMLILVFAVENVYDESNTCVGGWEWVWFTVLCGHWVVKARQGPPGQKKQARLIAVVLIPNQVWKANMQHVEVSLIY